MKENIVNWEEQIVRSQQKLEEMVEAIKAKSAEAELTIVVAYCACDA